MHFYFYQVRVYLAADEITFIKENVSENQLRINFILSSTKYWRAATHNILYISDYWLDKYYDYFNLCVLF